MAEPAAIGGLADPEIALRRQAATTHCAPNPPTPDLRTRSGRPTAATMPSKIQICPTSRVPF